MRHRSRPEKMKRSLQCVQWPVIPSRTRCWWGRWGVFVQECLRVLSLLFTAKIINLLRKRVFSRSQKTRYSFCSSHRKRRIVRVRRITRAMAKHYILMGKLHASSAFIWHLKRHWASKNQAFLFPLCLMFFICSWGLI